MTKFVYDFSEGNKDMKDLLGGKGANLAEMTNMGLPVPHGFTISTEARAAIHSLPGFDVSRDGSRFVIPVVGGAEGPSIVVIQNWEGLLSHASRPNSP